MRPREYISYIFSSIISLASFLTNSADNCQTESRLEDLAKKGEILVSPREFFPPRLKLVSNAKRTAYC